MATQVGWVIWISEKASFIQSISKYTLHSLFCYGKHSETGRECFYLEQTDHCHQHDTFQLESSTNILAIRENWKMFFLSWTNYYTNHPSLSWVASSYFYPRMHLRLLSLQFTNKIQYSANISMIIQIEQYNLHFELS